MAAAYAAGAANLPFGVLRGYARHRPAARTRVGLASSARSPGSGWRPCGRSGRTSGSSTPSRPTAAVTSSSGGSAASRRRRCSRSARSIVTVEELVDELEPRPGAVVIPGWAMTAVARGARRRPPVLRARLLRARQRLLPELGRDQPRPRPVPGLDAAARARDGRRRGVPRSLRGGIAGMSDARHVHLGRDDGRRRRPPAARRHRLLRRHRAAQPGRQPGPGDPRARTACSSTRAARSAPARATCRSRSATASLPRPPRRSCRSRDVRLLAPGRRGSTSGSWARPRSTASATSTARSSATTNGPKVRLPGGGGAPEIAASCGETLVMLQHTPRTFVEQLDFRSTVGFGDGPGSRTAPAMPGRGVTAVITDLGDPGARPGHVRARADASSTPGSTADAGARGDRLGPASRRTRSRSAGRRPAASCEALRRLRAAGSEERGVSALRRVPDGDPPYLVHPGYRSTVLRAPARPLVMLPDRIADTTGPAFGDDRPDAGDADLTRQHAGEPLGERIVVSGRLAGRRRPAAPLGAGRDLAGQRRRPIRPPRRPAPRAARPQLHRRRPLPDR